MMLASRSGFTFKRATPPAPAGYWGLTFTAEEAGSTISMSAVGAPPSVSLECSTDSGNSWNEFIIGSTTITLAHIGDRACFRAGSNVGNSTFASSNTNFYHSFVMTGKIAASGDVTSILDRSASVDELVESFALCRIFSGCDVLTTPPILPSTTLSSSCYCNMFDGCSSLSVAPELPAQSVTTMGYGFMFKNCTSLLETPELNATNLSSGCYAQMFNGCSSLLIAHELPATTLQSLCYSNMFNGCSALTEAPEIHAQTLNTSCFTSMFKDCSSLNYIKVHFTQWKGTTNWVSGVNNEGTFVCPSSLPHDSSNIGAAKIPTSHWTVQTF